MPGRTASRSAVAPLPGSDRVFEPIRKEWIAASPRNTPSYLPRGGGWLVGSSAQLAGTQLEAALDFAKYLAGPENAPRIRGERAFPMLPVRTSQMGQGLPDPMSAPDVDSRLWSDAVSRTLLAERVVPGLRIPQADGLSGRPGQGPRWPPPAASPPNKALAAVAKAWTERTKQATGPNASSGIIAAVSIAWPHFPSLRIPASKRRLPVDDTEGVAADLERRHRDRSQGNDGSLRPAGLRAARPGPRDHSQASARTLPAMHGRDARHGSLAAASVVARRHGPRRLVGCLYELDRAALAPRRERSNRCGRYRRLLSAADARSRPT